MIFRLGTIAALSTLLIWTASAPAQPHTTLSPAKDGELANLVPVPVNDARSVALSETLGLLAFCQDGPRPEARVSLVRLDAKGNPAPYATTWKLPRPANPPKINAYAVSACFHPKLPLLYVWQDLAQPFPNPPKPMPPEIKPFDHLFIYNVAKDPPELVVALCRGDGYAWGLQGGALAVDSSGEFLHIPNVRDATKPDNFFFHLGRFRLDADGLLFLGEKEVKEPLAARVKKLTDLNTSKGLPPHQVTPLEYVYMFGFSYAGYGHSYYPLSRDVVIASNWSCLLSWRPDDKAATLHALPLKVQGLMLLGLHPRLPCVYATPTPTDSVFRVGLAEGYLTLLPHQYTIPRARLTSPPVVLAKSAKLAVGGRYHVYVADLGAEGELRPEVTRVPVLNAQVRALVYSERFDKLYVGVEVSK
jgi:hypothetical protein